jgi:hypothetical protein
MLNQVELIEVLKQMPQGAEVGFVSGGRSCALDDQGDELEEGGVV